MRLLDCSTLQLEDFFDANIPPYAILSHCWANDEVLFADITLNLASAKRKAGWQKIKYTCTQALQDGLDYAWIDTCCIDKTSSAELSEAINSMFRWYEGSTICYVYLADVAHTTFDSDFAASRWFTRGWTLQELLAPSALVFYSSTWHALGTKEDHAPLIASITYIDIPVLLKPNKEGQFKMQLRQLCAAKKMSWAAHRTTTRIEDAAYSLLGIFNINMPLLYGEGRKAFIRLQEEIIKICNDDSILAWDLDTMAPHPHGLVPEHVGRYLERTRGVGPYLAMSPANFVGCGKLQFADRATSAFTTTNHGLQIQLPLLKLMAPQSGTAPPGPRKLLAWLGLLSCSTGNPAECLALVLAPTGKRADTSKKFERLRLSSFPNPCSTIIVGPRMVFQSSIEKIVISRIDGTYQLDARHSGHYQVILNLLHTVQKASYALVSAARERIGTASSERLYSTTWDADAMLLTTDARDMSHDLLSFYFRSSVHTWDRGFTVFMHAVTERTLVLEGGTFEMHEKVEVHNSLYRPTGPDWDGVNKMPFQTAALKELRINFAVGHKKVYGWNILNVCVDIIA